LKLKFEVDVCLLINLMAEIASGLRPTPMWMLLV